MKKTIFKSWLLLCLLLVGVGSAWGETYSFTIQASDFNTTSYAANNGSHDFTATCTTDANKTMTVACTSNQVMLNSNNMQWQKSNGYIYNTTDLGTIKSVTVNSSAGTFTTNYGTTEHPTSGTTVGDGFFTVKVGGATGTTSSIVVVFEKSNTPAVAPEAPTFSSAAGSVEKGTQITFSSETTGCTFRYTTDGTTPTATIGTVGSTYTVNSDVTLKVVAIKGGLASAVSSASYTVATHTATFNVNGNVTNAQVAKGDAIPFPTDPEIDGVEFMGWATATIDGTQDDAPTFVNTATETMGTNDVTYYAVFATEEEGGTQWKLVSSLTNGKEYIFATKNVAGAAYALSSSVTTGTSVTIAESGTDKVISGEPANTIIWTAATGWSLTNKGVDTNNKLTINGSTFAINGTGSSNLSWTTNYGLNGQSGSGTTKYYVQCTNTGTFSKSSTSGSTTNRVYAYEKSAGVTYSDYCTIVSLDPQPTIVLSATELAEYAGNTNTSITASVSEGEYTGALTVASSAEAVVTASISEGTITINALTAGNATITVTAPAMTGFRKNTATIAVTVNEKLAHGLAFNAATLNLTVGDTEFSEPTLNNPNNLPVVYSLVYATPANEGKVATINSETGKITLAGLSTETQGAVTVKAATVGDNSHLAGEVTYNLVVARKVSTTTWSNGGSAVEIDQDEIETLPTASNDAERNLAYESSNTDVATIDNTGAVTFVAYGTTTITAKTSATSDYAATSATYELTFAPRYTVTFNVNGNETELREETSGAGVTAPAPDPIAGKVFRGWAEDEIDGTTDVAPAFVSTESLDGNKTLYAVFAQASGGQSTEEIAMNSTSVTQNGITIACAQSEGASAPAYSSNECRIYAKNTITISSDDYITALSLTFHKQGSKDYISTITANVGTYVSGGTSTSGEDDKVDTWTGSSKSITLTAGSTGQRVLVSASVTVGSITYSDYCTTVAAPAAVTLGAGGYSTFCAPYNYTISGATGYKVAGQENDVVTLEAIEEEDAVIAAGQGIILKGEAGDEVTITESVAAVTVTETGLFGTVAPTAQESGYRYYGIATKTEGTGFYPASSSLVLPAFKAFLKVKVKSGSAPARLDIIFNGNPVATGVDGSTMLTNQCRKALVNGKLVIVRDGQMFNVNGMLVK